METAWFQKVSEANLLLNFYKTKLAALKKTNEIFQAKAFRAKNVFCYLDNPSLWGDN